MTLRMLGGNSRKNEAQIESERSAFQCVGQFPEQWITFHDAGFKRRA